MYVYPLPIQCPRRKMWEERTAELGELILPIVSGPFVPDPWAHFALGSLSWALWPAQAATRKKEARQKAQKHRDTPPEWRKCVLNEGSMCCDIRSPAPVV